MKIRKEEKMNGNEGKTSQMDTAQGRREYAEETQEQPLRAEEKRGVAFFEQLFFGLMYAIWGYLLGGALLPFGARPLGIALLCGTDRRIFYVYAGLCLSAWQTEERILLISVYSAALLIRLLVRFALDTPWSAREGEEMGERTLGEVYPILFSEHVSLRMATSCIAAFAVGVYRLTEGGFLYYDLYGTLLGCIAAPAAVLLFTGFFSGEKVGDYRKMSGFLALAFALIWAVGDWKIYGISMAAFGCMFVTLYVTRKSGIVMGMVTGTVCGLAVTPQLAPLFAFSSLCSGLLFPISVFFAAVTAFSVGIAWGLYVSGIGVLNGLLAALLASVLLFAVLDKLFFSAEKAQEDTEVIGREKEAGYVCEPLAEKDLNGVRLNDTHRTVKELCESFSSLSEVFLTMSQRMRTPNSGDLRRICDNAFDASCASCSEKGKCWGERYHKTASEVGALSLALHQKGQVDREDAERSLKERCSRLPEILEEINHNAALHSKQILQGDRTEIFALDYAALSELLSSAMVRGKSEYECQEELTRRLCESLTELDSGLTGACVYGGRMARILIRGQDSRAMVRSKARIAEAVRRVCPFSVNEGEICDGDELCMEFEQTEALSVTYAQRIARAENEERYCGDTAGMFKNGEARFYAFISDGMGSGQEAALTSGISALFLKKLLSSGNSCETALKMLNGFLRNRGSGSLHECSATVDLMELDLMEGNASFYKSGAAPTYVFRDGSLFKIRSRTVPVGIIQELDTRRIGFHVGEGDVIVMVSDGVTQGKEECPWLFDLLRSQGENVSAERLADLIVKYAKEEGSTDDISVLVVKVGERAN